MKKNKSQKSTNTLFIVGCTLSLVFVIFPFIMLVLPCLRGCVSWWLSPLGASEYKATYIETLGAILGTFLAITGAIWTQRKIDRINERKEQKIAATIIYYDFDFALKDLQQIIRRYNDDTPKMGNILHDDACVQCFLEKAQRCRIYIDDNWISNVAKLTGRLSSGEIKSIYDLYGNLATIKSIFNSSTSSKSDYDTAYRLIYSMYCLTFSLSQPRQTEAKLKTPISTILGEIRIVAEIENTNNKETKK